MAVDSAQCGTVSSRLALAEGSGLTFYPFAGVRYTVVFSVVGLSPPAGIYHARVSTNGALLDSPHDRLRPSISGQPASLSRLVYPTIVSNADRSLLLWVDNTEMAGAAKDIVGVVMAPF